MKSSYWLRGLAVILGLFALGHTLGTAAPRVTRGADEAAVFDAMRRFRFPVMGYERSYWDFYRGFALTISIQLLITTIIAWQLGSLAKRDPRAALPMTGALVASSVGMLVLGRLFFFKGPIVFSALATVVGAVACVSLAREIAGEARPRRGGGATTALVD